MQPALRWLWLPALVGGALSVTPLLYMALRITAGWDAALAELIRPRTWELLGNTVLLTVLVTITALSLGVAQAWIASRMPRKLSGWFVIVATLPLALPSYVAALGWVASFPFLSGLLPAWLILSVGTAPYVFISSYAALQNTDWAAEDVARSIGAGRWRVFWRVTWPSIRSAATLSSLIVALYSLAEFGALAFLRYETFTIAIYNAYRSSFDRTAAATLSLVLLVLGLLIVLAEARFRSGEVQSIARSSRRPPLRNSVFGIAVALSLPSLIAVLIPVLSLVRWSISGRSRAEIPEILVASLNTIGIATLAALVIGAFALSFALVTQRSRGRTARSLSALVWSTHSLPALVVALALVFFGSQYLSSIYLSLPLLLIGYLILMLPNAVAGVSNPILRVPRRLEETAQTLGESAWGVLRRVTLPLALPGILAAVALVAIAVFRELPLTLLLRPTGIDTLATELWSATAIGSFAQAAPFGLAIVLLAGVPAVLLYRSSRGTVRERVS